MSPVGPVLVFDVETTGLQKDRDQIIELAVQVGLSPDAPRRCWRFCPTVPMDPDSERVHGIGAADLAAEPPFAACAAELHALFGEARVLIGYNVSFDLDMLQAEFARGGPPPARRGRQADRGPLPALGGHGAAGAEVRAPSLRRQRL